jgi:hypothetical protein
MEPSALQPVLLLAFLSMDQYNNFFLKVDHYYTAQFILRPGVTAIQVPGARVLFIRHQRYSYFSAGPATPDYTQKQIDCISIDG